LLVPGRWLLGTGCWLLERERLKAEGLTIGDSFDWGFQIADLGFIKRIYILFYNEKTALRWKAERERLTAEGIKSDIFPYSNPKSAIPNPQSYKWLRTRRRIFFGNLLPSYRLRSIHDTDRITYRCFLPDLTRFMTVCCVASNQNGLRAPSVRPLGGNSAPHKRISGKGHR